ncbi:hypothetical protein HK405_012869 [Cladochytrium tenue]|nr:hypothetical protein HK405_012869 [Cladochytrium tenue]
MQAGAGAFQTAQPQPQRMPMRQLNPFASTPTSSSAASGGPAPHLTPSNAGGVDNIPSRANPEGMARLLFARRQASFLALRGQGGALADSQAQSNQFLAGQQDRRVQNAVNPRSMVEVQHQRSAARHDEMVQLQLQLAMLQQQQQQQQQHFEHYHEPDNEDHDHDHDHYHNHNHNYNHHHHFQHHNHNHDQHHQHQHMEQQAAPHQHPAFFQPTPQPITSHARFPSVRDLSYYALPPGLSRTAPQWIARHSAAVQQPNHSTVGQTLPHSAANSTQQQQQQAQQRSQTHPAAYPASTAAVAPPPPTTRPLAFFALASQQQQQQQPQQPRTLLSRFQRFLVPDRTEAGGGGGGGVAAVPARAAHLAVQALAQGGSFVAASYGGEQ